MSRFTPEELSGFGGEVDKELIRTVVQERRERGYNLRVDVAGGFVELGLDGVNLSALDDRDQAFVGGILKAMLDWAATHSDGGEADG